LSLKVRYEKKKDEDEEDKEKKYFKYIFNTSEIIQEHMDRVKLQEHYENPCSNQRGLSEPCARNPA